MCNSIPHISLKYCLQRAKNVNIFSEAPTSAPKTTNQIEFRSEMQRLPKKLAYSENKKTAGVYEMNRMSVFLPVERCLLSKFPVKICIPNSNSNWMNERSWWSIRAKEWCAVATNFAATESTHIDRCTGIRIYFVIVFPDLFMVRVSTTSFILTLGRTQKPIRRRYLRTYIAISLWVHSQIT